MVTQNKKKVLLKAHVTSAQKMQIAWQNKDIISKIFAENFGSRSLDAYGISLPRIVNLLPTNLPAIIANELRIDNLFLMEDGSVAIIDYESDYTEEAKLKYLNYLIRVLQKRWPPTEKPLLLRMIVIYTADVLRTEVTPIMDTGALKLRIEPAFLSDLNADQIWAQLKSKVESGKRLSETEIMWFIIFPLAYRTKEKKKEALRKAIELAKNIQDEKTARFIISGLTVFCDKIIDRESKEEVRRWIEMTQIGRMFEEEKKKAVNELKKTIKEKDNELLQTKKKLTLTEDKLSQMEAKLLEYEQRYGTLPV